MTVCFALAAFWASIILMCLVGGEWLKALISLIPLVIFYTLGKLLAR